eukprot:CAMPEP_0169390506 /NCGR_PEP_ID=MMETSP1017-20121227/47407_1 /TAXON_ID=342587 /ORGANISM="Karlodinium micrum, Strain CCMP2283" /LENGTH=75 /DNA_ID=CAMNT_0009492955 /DNA_START=357 /DNA_END=584 /DNA_ORIENTATION=+
MDFIYGEEKKKMKGKHAHEKKDITNWHHATACLTFVLIILHFLTAIQSYMYYNMKTSSRSLRKWAGGSTGSYGGV